MDREEKQATDPYNQTNRSTESSITARKIMGKLIIPALYSAECNKKEMSACVQAILSVSLCLYQFPLPPLLPSLLSFY